MNATLPVRPYRLPPNLTWRSYLGGSELRTFRELAPGADDHFPEDWLASTTRARNGENSQSPEEGVSRLEIAGGWIAMPDALARRPDVLWGPGVSRPAAETGVLIKLLDSGTRLHVQAHPDAAFVSRRFGGSAGKTECWYILSTRGAGYVYLGFQRAPSRDEWKGMVETQDIDGMLGCFDRIPVQAGDCYVVPAGTPHAIGEGVLMIELQEPTDWVVRCEFEVGGHRLPHAARYMGLELDDVLDIFDYAAYSPAEVRRRFLQDPTRLAEGTAYTEDEIIHAPWHRFFRLRRMAGTGDGSWRGGELMVLIATRGAGRLSCGDDVQPVRTGETWLLPGAAGSWRWQADAADWEVLLAQPPAAPR